MREATNYQETSNLAPKSAIFTQSGCTRRETLGKFCELGIDSLLDGRIAHHYEFSLGVIATVDAIARGTFDFDSDEIEIIDLIEQMWHDVTNVTDTPNKITDIWGELER